MKKIILLIISVLLFQNSFAQTATHNNWITVGGNNNRDGYGPDFFELGPFSRTYTAPNSIWGMPIFCYKNNFATTRYTSLSPLRALVAAYNFQLTNPIWTYGENSGVNIIMGFNNEKVYVRDFQQNGNDTIFALNASSGALIWKSRFTVERGIIWTAVFADNGDLILPGSGNNRIMRINHTNGDTVWTNRRITPNTGAESMCINGNTLYAFQGSITTPKTLIAIDLNTGITKYSSPDLPGDGDQEIPFTVSRGGVAYVIRDGGLMYAIRDNGSSLNILWSRSVAQPVGTYSQFAVGKDSSVYIPFGKKVYRLNHLTGASMDSTVDLVSSGTINPRFGISRSGFVCIGNGASEPANGKFFIFSADLQNLIREIPWSFNYYCGPSFGGALTNPNFLYTGAGTEIKSLFSIIDNIKYLPSNIPDRIALSQNYPNPFNPSTKFKFSIPSDGNVEVKLFDVLGIELETFVQGSLMKGEYEVEFNGSKYSSGIYFYKLIVNETNSGGSQFTLTKKMNLIK